METMMAFPVKGSGAINLKYLATPAAVANAVLLPQSLDAMKMNYDFTYWHNVASIACVIYGSTLYWMIRAVRKRELEYVKNALNNPIWPRTDLKFFFSIYKKYHELSSSKVLISLNLVSLLTVLICLFIKIISIDI